jgi:hypothetical protein
MSQRRRRGDNSWQEIRRRKIAVRYVYIWKLRLKFCGGLKGKGKDGRCFWNSESGLAEMQLSSLLLAKQPP